MNPEDSDGFVFRRFLGFALLTFAVPFALIWLWVIKEPLAYRNFKYPVLLAKSTLAQEARAQNVAILGDSVCQVGLIPHRLGVGVVNLAWAGRSPIEALHFAKIEVNGPTPPKAVIISLTPTRFVAPDTFWEGSVGYGLLTSEEVEEVRRQSVLLNDTSISGPQSPGDVDARLKCFLYSIQFPSYYFAELFHSHFYGRYAQNKQVYKNVLLKRGQAYIVTVGSPSDLDHETALTSFVPSKIMDYYFDQTLALLQSRNIPVYYLSIPHNEVSVRIYSPAMEQEFTDYLNNYVHRYGNFHLLGDLFPSYPPTYFADSVHLNEQGAVRFSDFAAKLLNDSHVEGGLFGPN